MTSSSSITFSLSTPLAPGAIAIFDVFGDDVHPLLGALTGSNTWVPDHLYVRDIAGVDRGVVVLMSKGRAQIMPHGGPRVRQRIRDAMLALGARQATETDPRDEYPEASSWIEAAALQTLARATSDEAIDLLLDQPRRWAEVARTPEDTWITQFIDAQRRSDALNRLVRPPAVAVVGPPNAGKSTLTNALMGRSTSVVANRPGTTRDYVGSMLDLAGIVTWWYDTPGIRLTDDDIESEAQDLALGIILKADCVIAVRGPGQSWPSLPGWINLRVRLQSDRPDPDEFETAEAADLEICAVTGSGLAGLTSRIREILVPTAVLHDPGPWLFDLRIDHDRIRGAD